MSKNLETIIKEQEQKEQKQEISKKYNELREKIRNEMKRSSRNVGQILITISFMLLTLVIVGLPTLFTMGWDWSIYASEEFWVNYLTVQLASWFTRVWILTIKNNRNKIQNSIWLKTTDSIQEFLEKDKVEPFINYNCEITNKNRKIRAYRNVKKMEILKLSMKYQVENILNRLERHTTVAKDPFKLKSSIITHKENKNENKLELFIYARRKKKLKKVEAKINKLLELISDEYINSNLDNLKVKYNKESRSVLTTGFAPKSENAELGYSYKEKSLKEFLSATMPMFLFVSAIMFLIVPLLGDINNDWNSWYRFITNVFLVVVSAGTMWYTADDLFVKTKLRVLTERDDTLRTFSKNPQPQEVIVVEQPKIDVEIEKEESTQ